MSLDAIFHLAKTADDLEDRLEEAVALLRSYPRGDWEKEVGEFLRRYDADEAAEEAADEEEWDPYAAAGESPFGLPGGDRSL